MRRGVRSWVRGKCEFDSFPLIVTGDTVVTGSAITKVHVGSHVHGNIVLYHKHPIDERNNIILYTKYIYESYI
jgi:F0F1-type ATP synthase alpha subunit